MFPSFHQFPAQGVQAKKLSTPMGTWVGVHSDSDEHGFPRGTVVGVSPSSFGPAQEAKPGEQMELFHYNRPKMHTLFATEGDPHVGAAIQTASDESLKKYGSRPESDTSLSPTSLPLMKGLAESGVVHPPEGGFPNAPTNDYDHEDSKQIVPEKLQQVMGAKESEEIPHEELSAARTKLRNSRKGK